MRKWWISVALVAPFLPSLEAARFRVTAAGSPITGAEVCLFQAGPVANPVGRFFRATEVSCSPADEDVPIPTGDWNVYARKGSEYISERVELITAKQKPGELHVVAAAKIDASGWPLDKTERLFIYIPRTGSAMPLDTIAPAGVVVPILVRDRRIAEVGEVMVMPAEEMKQMARPAKTAAAAVVAPILVQSVPAGTYQAPEVVVIDASGRQHRNLTPISRVLEDTTALAIFRDVPPGAVAAKLAGPRWKTAETSLEAVAPVVVLEKPLLARPSSKLTVHWWTPVDLATLRPPQPECAAKPDWINTVRGSDAKEFAAEILICPDEPNVIAAKCVSWTSHPLDSGELRGRVEFEDVPAGAHYVNFSYPGLPEVLKKVEVTREAESVADVELRYVSFYGKVTRGGEPVHARVFGTVTDPETGRYVAVLSRLPVPPVPNSVTFCDGSGVYRFVLDEALKENTEFNIEIPENRLIVEVVEKKTGGPLKDVSVSLGALHPGSPRAMHYGGHAGKTDDAGRLVIEPLLRNRQISVCASHPDYDGACADRFEMKDVREKTVRIELEPVVKRRGRLVGANAKTSEVVWFSRDGRLTEMVRDFAANGDFIYKKPHAEGEIVIALGADHPLYAFFQPRIQDDEVFQIVFPQARRRTFQVTLSEGLREEGGWVTVQLGDVVVPINAMGWHQMARGIQGSLRPGWTTTIPDVLETGPITIVLVPFSVMKQYQNTRIEMPFIPEYGSLPKLRPGESDSVTFE